MTDFDRALAYIEKHKLDKRSFYQALYFAHGIVSEADSTGEVEEITEALENIDEIALAIELMVKKEQENG